MSNIFDPSPLTTEQQELLLAAFASNQDDHTIRAQPATSAVFNFGAGRLENPMFSNLDPSNLSEPSFLDFIGNDALHMSTLSKQSSNLGVDSNFDLDFDSDIDEPVDGDEDPLDVSSPARRQSGDAHEKRKKPGDTDEDGDDSNDGADKRSKNQGKIPRKPGRKPLLTEPVSKRKAQNRAAQRAFRERKEKHLKDLETKVSELEQSSESINHENGLLRAQVDKLTKEVKEYRNRLLTQTSARHLKTKSTNTLANLSTTSPSWNLDFSQLGSQSMFGAAAGQSGVGSKNDKANADSPSHSISPHFSTDANSTPKSIDSPDNWLGASGSLFKPMDTPSTLPHTVDSPLSYNIFTSSIPQENYSPLYLFDQMAGEATQAGIGLGDNIGSNNTHRNRTSTTTSKLFQARPNPRTDSGPGISPAPGRHGTGGGSASSYIDSPSSNAGRPSSSCGTTPEPSGSSLQSNLFSTVDLKPIDENQTLATESSKSTRSGLNSAALYGFDSLPKDPFAPMSWMDVTDQTSFIFGGGNAMFGNSGSSLDSAFTMFAPSNWNELTGNSFLASTLVPDFSQSLANTASTAPQDTPVTPQTMGPTLDKKLPKPSSVPCYKIWDKLQKVSQVKDGTIDIDSLCAELKQKAKCSESGIVIDQKDIEEAVVRTNQKSLAKDMSWI